MRRSRVILLSIFFLLSVSFLSIQVRLEIVSPQQTQIPLLLVLRFIDYNTGVGVSNITISATIETDLGLYTVESLRTNETGTIEFSIGSVLPDHSFNYQRLKELEISDNYTLIKIQEVFIEVESWSTRYLKSSYIANGTKHVDLRVSLSDKALEDQYIIEGNIWILKGKLISVPDKDPVNGDQVTLLVKPAFKTSLTSGVNGFESLYFFPIDYDITIYYEQLTNAYFNTSILRPDSESFTPIRIKIEENSSIINWIYHAAKEYAAVNIYYIEKDLRWLESVGYSLEKEAEEFEAIKKLLERAIDLYDRKEYIPALGGVNVSDQKISELKTWISDIKILALVTTFGISLFAYGLASLMSFFVFEEPHQNRTRLAVKILTFSFMMLIFSLSHPALKMTFANVTGSSTIDLPLSLAGCFLISCLTYFFIQLFSLRKKAITDLSIQLAMRSLKRRRSRTVLTLTTIIIIVSAAIVFVNISLNRATRVKGQWQGTEVNGVLIQPDLVTAPLAKYDVNWTSSQKWCGELAYVEGINPYGMIGENPVYRMAMLVTETLPLTIELTAIDPVFTEEHHNISELMSGFWDDFITGQPVAIVPTTLGILIGESIDIESHEMDTFSGAVHINPLGSFEVIGTFDPQTSFENLTKIDGNPLFKETTNLILIPISSIINPAITISEVTVLVSEGYDPFEVAKELAFTLASTTIANNDGISQKIVWSVEFSITGLIPYIPPIFIAGLMMYTTMVSVYEERRREFTTLATLGLDPGNTFKTFLVEALLMGLMGTFISFFGSYLLVATLYYISSAVGVQSLPDLSSQLNLWSMPAILVALLTGVVMVFLGGYVPASRAKGLSLMGRKNKRELIGALISEGEVTSYTLPIRETVQNSELLYSYVRETIGTFNRSLVDLHSVQGERYRDGSFKVSFTLTAGGYQTNIPCEINGNKNGEMLVTAISFPSIYKNYEKIRKIVGDLEKHMIGFSTWRDMQLKMTIVREAPKRSKSIEEILEEIKAVIEEIKEYNKKLMYLEGQKGKISEEVYTEFRQKYVKMSDDKTKTLRSMTINLEPYHKELHGEIDKIGVEVERITTAHDLSEITEEEYVKTCGPLQVQLTELNRKVQEIEAIFDFLKRPLGIITG